MLTQTCSLRFANGQIVTATVTAQTENHDGPVLYSGSVDRLPLRPRTANAVELRAYFQSFARELHAVFTESATEDRPVITSEIDKLLDGLKGLAAQRKKARTHGKNAPAKSASESKPSSKPGADPARVRRLLWGGHPPLPHLI